jgi:hypothetical protein
MFRQDCIVAQLRYCFSSQVWGYSSVVKYSPLCSGHWFWFPALLKRRKPPGVFGSSYHSVWYYRKAEGWVSQGSFVGFSASFTLETSLLCIPGAASDCKEPCSLWTRKVPRWSTTEPPVLCPQNQQASKPGCPPKASESQGSKQILGSALERENWGTQRSACQYQCFQTPPSSYASCGKAVTWEIKWPTGPVL